MTRAQRIAGRAMERAYLQHSEEASEIREAIESAVRIAFEVAATYVDDEAECHHGTGIAGVGDKIRSMPDQAGP